MNQAFAQAVAPARANTVMVKINYRMDSNFRAGWPFSSKKG
jgi:hypothetical protein